MGDFKRALRKKNSVIGNDADWVSKNMCKRRDYCCSIERFKFVKATAIDDTGHYFAHIVNKTMLSRNDTEYFCRIENWVFWRQTNGQSITADLRFTIQIENDIS